MRHKRPCAVFLSKNGRLIVHWLLRNGKLLVIFFHTYHFPFLCYQFDSISIFAYHSAYHEHVLKWAPDVV